MVIFIMCLLAVVLGTITFAHYIIEKPKKEFFRKQITDFIRRHTKSSQSASDRAQGSLINSASSLNNAKGSKDSLKNNNGGGGGVSNSAGPNIIITDFSSMVASSNQRVSSPNFLERLSESAEETDALLEETNTAPCYVAIANSTNTNKVSFHVGETIIEEESPVASPLPQLDEKPVFAAGHSDDSNSNGADGQEEGTDKACLESISHLLDDKPWMSSSQAVLTSPSMASSRPSFVNQLPTASSTAKFLNKNTD